MTISRDKQIMKLAIKAGELMMHSGAEIYRVEDTIVRICYACGIENVEVFASPTGIFVSIDTGDDEQAVMTSISRIHGGGTDLKRISELNKFSREFTTTDLSIEAGLARLDAIGKEPIYPKPVKCLGAFLISFFFCLLYSANIFASVCAGACGMITLMLNYFMKKKDANYFLCGVTATSVTTILAMFCHMIDSSMPADAIIIGTLMIYVPGAAITNSIRDFLSGDMLAGISRLTDAFVVAVALATGVGIFLKVFQAGTIPLLPINGHCTTAMQMMVGFASTLGFAILTHTPKKNLLATSIIGGLGWCLTMILSNLEYGDITASFLGTVLIGILAAIASRTFKEASTIFTIPAIMPLVPGGRIFYTMAFLLDGNLQQAAITGAETIFLAGAIAIGLLVVGAIVRIVFGVQRGVTRTVRNTVRKNATKRIKKERAKR